MTQKYKIFVRNKPIILTDSSEKIYDNELRVMAESRKEIADVLKYMEDNPFHDAAVLQREDLDGLWEDFRSFHKFIEAAGGLVWNNANHLLVIFRKGKYDLPKGGVEKNESIMEAAEREVKEECGISEIKIKKDLIPTYHSYYEGNTRALKKTYWFEMKCFDSQSISPQTKEGITALFWLKGTEMKGVFGNTYGNLFDLFNYALEKMGETPREKISD